MGCSVALARTDVRSPLVSILIPHFRCEQYLQASVRSILRQSVASVEVLVADDASGDERWLDSLTEHVSDRRLRLYAADRNVGMFRLINRLLSEARAPYIAFQDADDVSLPDRLAAELRCIRKTRAAIVGTGYIEIDELGKPLRTVRMVRRADRWCRLGKTFVTMHPTTIVARHVFEVLDGFDGTARFAADTDFILRAATMFRVRNVRRSLYLHRQRPGSLTQSPETGFGSHTRDRYVRAAVERARARRRLRHSDLMAAVRAPANDIDFTLNAVDI
jgi:glycosyltransferase involved in cell wall biosynthesis